MDNKKEGNLIIEYNWDKNDSNGLDLDLLGESMIGFNKAIREIVRILGIKGDPLIKARVANDGSIIFDLLIDVLYSGIPFENVQAYIDFLSITGWKTAKDGLELTARIHKDLNDLYAENPLTGTLLVMAILKLVKWAPKQKDRVTVKDNEGQEIPRNYAIKLNKLVNKRKGFKKALKPFTEDKLTKVILTSKQEMPESVVIDEDNFDRYLSEDEQILPEYEDGEVYRFRGKIVSLQSTRGEYMQFKAEGVKRDHNLLVAYPGEGKNTEDFLDYYKQNVSISAKVMRKSLYKKPKIIIQDIDVIQKPFI